MPCLECGAVLWDHTSRFRVLCRPCRLRLFRAQAIGGDNVEIGARLLALYWPIWERQNRHYQARVLAQVRGWQMRLAA